jgi:hypothetical protein
MSALQQMIQSILKHLKEQIDAYSQSIETIERTKIKEMSRIQLKYDKRAEKLPHTLDSELNKMHAKIEVVEQRASERRREGTGSAIRAIARIIPSDNRVERG